MVLNEVTDSEKKLELTLTTMPKIHQGRYEAANDMHERAQKQFSFLSGLPGVAVKKAVPTLDEANPNVGAAPVDF